VEVGGEEEEGHVCFLSNQAALEGFLEERGGDMPVNAVGGR